MRNPSTFLDDLQVLLKVFQLPEKALVYDPSKSITPSAFDAFEIVHHLNEKDTSSSEKRVLVNLSAEKITSEVANAFDFILAFKTKNQQLERFYSEAFYFINSPDGTVRWIFQKALKYPGFLSLYNSSGLKATVFQQVVKLAFQMQTQHLICSGKLQLFSKKENHVQQLYAEEGQRFSIFTGTVGPNRKAIIALHEKKKTTHFVKYPLTENSAMLVDNEWNHLRCLGQFQFENIEVPKVAQLSASLRLSNIKPKTYFVNTKLQDLHYAALTELYDQTTRYCTLSSIPGWSQSLDDLFFLFVNCEDSDSDFGVKMRHTVGKMYELSQQIDEHLELPIAYSHGDFTPWNMYLAEDRLCVYDWELASLHRPMLYDFFHFIFQTHILIKRSSFKVISEAVNEMKQHPAIRKLIGKYDIDFDLHYQLYLLFNCSYYIKLYVNQKRMHEQAHWLIDCWLEAFQDLTAQKVGLLESSRA